MRNGVALGLVYLSFFCVCIQGIEDIFLSESTIRDKAFDAACKRHGYRNLECKNDDGWNIYGFDIGCCGNYDGCCTLATKMCYLHDKMCQCCSFGWLVCGPDCKPEPYCTGSNDPGVAAGETSTSMEMSPKHKHPRFTSSSMVEDHYQHEAATKSLTSTADSGTTDSNTQNTSMSLTSVDSVSGAEYNVTTFDNYHRPPGITDGSGMNDHQWNITALNNKSETSRLGILNDENKYITEDNFLMDTLEKESSNKSKSVVFMDKDDEGSGEAP